MSKFNISGVIVTYNPNIVILERQIISLLNQVDYIIYVDNNSSNIFFIEELIHKYNQNKKIILIKNLTNYGLGFAQNIGIKYASKLNVNDILILDHDSVINFDFCKYLLIDRQNLINEGKIIGAIGPIYFDEHTQEIYPITKFKGPFIERIKIYENPIEATFIIASGSLVDLKVYNTVGLLNEDLFIDYIDVEWCLRAKKFGYKIYVSPNAKMKHSIGDKRLSVFGRTISIHNPIRRYYLTRNSIYMIRLSSIPLGYKMREFSLNIIRFFVLFFTQKEKLVYFKYFIAGIYDGLTGKFGKCTYNFS